MNAATMVVSPQELAIPPEPRVRTCPECYSRDPRNSRHPLTDDWHCEGCGLRMVVHSEPLACEGCGTGRVTYFANRRKQWCLCGMSREERDELALREVELERQKAREQQKALEAQLEQERKLREAEVLQRKADRCWEGKGRTCKVTAKKPTFAFCLECVHLKPRTTRPRPSHLETPPRVDSSVEFEEYDEFD